MLKPPICRLPLKSILDLDVPEKPLLSQPKRAPGRQLKGGNGDSATNPDPTRADLPRIIVLRDVDTNQVFQQVLYCSVSRATSLSSPYPSLLPKQT